MIIPVDSFNQIEIIPGSLVILDIDETVLTFPQMSKTWWREKINYYIKIYGDKLIAEKYALDEWIHIAHTTNPNKLDFENQKHFFERVYKNNCELIFLTARNQNLSEITYKHLEHIGINKDHVVHFDENKGEKFYELISKCYNDINNVIFVDDLIINLDKVINATKKYNIKINLKPYHINHNY